MTTLTIRLPDDIAARLAQRAAVFKTSVTELAEAFIMRGIEDEDNVDERWDPSLSAEEIASIELGLVDVKAGRVMSHETVMADLRKLLAG